MKFISEDHRTDPFTMTENHTQIMCEHTAHEERQARASLHCREREERERERERKK